MSLEGPQRLTLALALAVSPGCRSRRASPPPPPLGVLHPSSVTEDPRVSDPDNPVWRELWARSTDPGRDRSTSMVRLLDHLRPAPGERLGDLGAGAGYLTFRLAELVGQGGMVYATDTDGALLRWIVWEARRRGVANVQARRVSPERVGLDPGSVDALVLCNVYLFDRGREGSLRGWLREAWEALRPGGRFVVLDDFFRSAPFRVCESCPVARQLTPEEVALLAPGRFQVERRERVAVARVFRPGEAPGYLFTLRRLSPSRDPGGAGSATPSPGGGSPSREPGGD